MIINSRVKHLLGTDGDGYKVFYDEDAELVEVETPVGLATFPYKLQTEPRFGLDSWDVHVMLVEATKVFNNSNETN